MAMIVLSSFKRETFSPRTPLFAPWRASALLAGALALGGCSMALPSLIDTEPTGSIKPKVAVAPSDFDPRDWRIAEPVLASSLRAPAPAKPAVWSNADTGAHGEFLAVAGTFVRGEDNCRAFIARLADGKTTKTLQAVGCPHESGDVAIFDASPWGGL